MIGFITGQVVAHDERTVTVNVNGIGLQVFVLPRLIEQVGTTETKVKILTYLHVREDALDLYGFLEPGELRLFGKLISVSGVGPRMALGVMSAASVTDLEEAIEKGQSALLTKVSGVGKKTAERIIVDLRGKLAADHEADDSQLASVIDALVGLGYSSREAREAAAATLSTLSAPDRIKAALKQLGR